MSGDISAAMLIPLLISGCGISLTAIVVLIYHLLVVHYCLGRQNQLTADTNLGFGNTDSVPPTKLGIDNSALGLIPTGPYSARMFDDVLKGDQSECAICLADLEDGDPVRILPNCCHVFHVECIDQWLSSHVNCPFCRSEIFPFVSEWIVKFDGGDDMEGCRIGCPVPVYRSKNNPPGSGVGWFGRKNITPMENPNNPNTDNNNDVIASTPSSSTSNVVGETSHIEINVAENENENENENNNNDNRPASSSTSFSSCPSPNGSANVMSEASISSQFDKMSTRLMRSLSQLRAATWGPSSSSTVGRADSDSPC